MAAGDSCRTAARRSYTVEKQLNFSLGRRNARSIEAFIRETAVYILDTPLAVSMWHAILSFSIAFFS